MGDKKDDEKIGKISIADDVVASIAGIAAMEVEGVYKLSGNVTRDLVGKLGGKSLSNGVSIEISERRVIVNISMEMEYGYNIKKASEEVQSKVKQAIETMTGLNVKHVNVVVSGVKSEKN